MSRKKLHQSLQAGDVIEFDIEAFGINGRRCDPKSLNNISIYFVERDLMSSPNLLYESKFYQEEAGQILENEETNESVKEKIEALTTKSKVYYKDLKIVNSLGCDSKPIWYQGIEDHDPLLKHTGEGAFSYEWNSKNMLSGDYILFFTWVTINDSIRKSNVPFFLNVSDEKFPNPFKAKFDYETKYNFLFEKYLPQMYKRVLSPQDITPEAIQVLRKAISKEFAFIENILQELLESYDVRKTNDHLIHLLANMFNIKLRGDNNKLWVAQVKNAVPLLKQKGTYSGLHDALKQAGIKLNKVTRLWQVMPNFTWTDSFRVKSDGQSLFNLTKNVYDEKLELFIREEGSKEYKKLKKDFFTLMSSIDKPGKTVLVWESSDVQLFEGDFLKAVYEYKEGDKDLEDYILKLPLADDRDESLQKYPLKNWNLRLIKEDDPLFDTIIPERHPFCKPLSFGKIRTTVLYSEKMYNTDAYSGTERDSNHPCDIDKDFYDNCSYGQSSKINLNIEIEELSDIRIMEAKEIINEYIPFHASVHTLEIAGNLKDFIIGPVEDIETEVEGIIDSNTEEIKCNSEIICLIEEDGEIKKLRL